MSVCQSQQVIINTRPVAQAAALTRLLQDNHFKVVELPLIEIKDDLSEVDLYRYQNQLESADLLIFISANAVVFYFKYFLKEEATVNSSLLLKIPVAVIGKSTAEVFAQYAGRKADIIPQSGSDSESLLAHPYLNQLVSQQGNRKNILIVRGRGGREFLATQLRLKNALVNYIELYSRVCPAYDETYLQELLNNLGASNSSNKWNSKSIGFMIISSGESLDNLMKLTKKMQFAHILKMNLIVIHKKIQEKAVQYGFSGRILVSQTASNPSILQILLNADK